MSDYTLDAREVIKNMKDMPPRVQAGLTQIGETVASSMKGYAQSNARWQDRTGDARNQIEAKAEWVDTTLDISINHKMDYGYWLETRNFSVAGNLAILQESRDSQVEAFKTMITALKL